jgi:hypothetical protein
MKTIEHLLATWRVTAQLRSNYFQLGCVSKKKICNICSLLSSNYIQLLIPTIMIGNPPNCVRSFRGVRFANTRYVLLTGKLPHFTGDVNQAPRALKCWIWQIWQTSDWNWQYIYIYTHDKIYNTKDWWYNMIW